MFGKNNFLAVSSIDRLGRIFVGSVQIGDEGVGAPASIIMRGDLIIVYRDVLGCLRVFTGPCPSKDSPAPKFQNTNLTALLKIDGIVCWDPSISSIGLTSMRICWVGSDGRVHCLEGFGNYKSFKHDTIGMISEDRNVILPNH